MFDWLTRKKLSSVAIVDESFRYDEKAVPDSSCKPCSQGWPIHVNGKGERMHIDVVGFHKDYGFSQPCPTQDWPDEEKED